MGNMSNPCINRWGLSSLWYHYWYSDSKYYLNLQQDVIFLKLIRLYLSYGSDYSARMIWNPFWYKTGIRPLASEKNKYYRWTLVYNELRDEEVINQYRIESPERFDTRISVLRFNSWFIFNLYWFQPDKGSRRRRLNSRVTSYTNPLLLIEKSHSKLSKLSTLTRLTSISCSANYNF